jgi:plastocyanin
VNRWIASVIVLLALALVAGGCGGGDEEAEPEQPPATETAPGEETTLQLAADPGGGLKFDKETLEAPAGTITIELANDSSLPHNVAIEGGGVDEESETVTGESTSLTVELQPGTYTFYCSVPGHQEGGMEGTFTVS